MTWAAVVGDPIDHSLSPALHRRAYQLLGLDWEYKRFRVNAAQLPAFMQALPADCAGLSVTMPCKRAVLGSVDATESLAKLLRVANTVVIQGGLRAAFNTDVAGIVEALRPLLGDGRGTPVILGNGATACSALAAMATLGHRRVAVVARSLAGADGAFATAQKLGIEATAVPLKLTPQVVSAVNHAPIVVSTIPPAASSEIAAAISPRPGATILDVTYSAGKSPLSQAFSQQGGTVVDPLSMLAHQGIAQVKLMTDREVPYAPIYQAVCAAASSR